MYCFHVLCLLLKSCGHTTTETTNYDFCDGTVNIYASYVSCGENTVMTLLAFTIIINELDRHLSTNSVTFRYLARAALGALLLLKTSVIKLRNF